MRFLFLLYVFLDLFDYLQCQFYSQFYPGPYSAFGNDQRQFFSGQGPFYGNLPPPSDYFDPYVPQPRSTGPGMFGGGIGQAISSGFAGFPASLTASNSLRRGVPPFSSFRGGYLPSSSPLFVPHQSPYLHQHHLLAAVITDKDNFQAQGCGWDGVRQRCTDILGICKGGCRDFSLDLVTHDCRCVPFGYAALYNGSIGHAGKKKKKK